MRTYKETAIFVLESLLKQGKLSYTKTTADDGPACRYRLQDGDTVLKCAAGHCIPDEDYRLEFEGFSIYGLRTNRNFTFKNDDWTFLRELQVIHDSLPDKIVDPMVFLSNVLTEVNLLESDVEILSLVTKTIQEISNLPLKDCTTHTSTIEL